MYQAQLQTTEEPTQPPSLPPPVPANVKPKAELKMSQRLGLLLDAIARRLMKVEPLLDSQPDLRQITIVITLGKNGRPRTVIFRTESKSELS